MQQPGFNDPERRDAHDHTRLLAAMKMDAWHGDIRAQLSGVVAKIESHASSGQEWKHFRTQLEQAQPELARSIRSCTPPLTDTEVKVCLLSGMQVSDEDIARLLRCSERSVGVYRKKVQMKLNAQSELKIKRISDLLG